MTTIFPLTADPGDPLVISGKRYVYDGEKWELQPLLDRYTAEKPEVVNELPVVEGGDTIVGVGRTIEHTFTIKDLEDLETI